MIIDDDPVITAVYARHFRNGGFEVYTANSGKQGLKAVHRFRPDAVLLDLDMPDVSGVAWLQEVRGDARFARLPVLVLTAGAIGWQVWAASNSDVTFAFKEGAVPEDIVKAVNAVLEAAALKAPIADRLEAAGGSGRNQHL
jgi:CheY-like chemotaxis protein